MATIDDVLTRARAACGRPTVYWVGQGGLDAGAPTPTSRLPVGRLWPSLPAQQQAELEPLAAAAGLDVHDAALVVDACDCVGYVCWAMGFGRRTDPAPFTTPDGWIFTDSIWADAMHDGVRFRRLERAERGGLVVYPKAGSGEAFGHIAIVVDVDAAGRAAAIAHCSAANFKAAPFDAVKITSAEAFERQPRSLYVWCRDIG
jgi:CHAP domain